MLACSGGELAIDDATAGNTFTPMPTSDGGGAEAGPGTGEAGSSGSGASSDSGGTDGGGMANCSDGEKNGNESDVDCGGDCTACAPGQACNMASDCESQSCTGTGACAPPLCDDMIANGSESDVDCGGTCPTKCGDGKGCTGNDDCESGSCNGGLCSAAFCANGVQDMPFGETDVDCGGTQCPPCADGQSCTDGPDCVSGVCNGTTCATPDCGDGLKNGDETDVDCGGSCDACTINQGCMDGDDCDSGVCQADLCVAGSCGDGKANNGESDVDCGGGCAGCTTGQMCNSGTDCEDEVCTGSVCAAPTCTDGFENGSETDVDCGGTACGPCADGMGCAQSSDCMSSNCNVASMTCASPGCGDGVQNGTETDTDCGGSCGATCAQGRMCSVGGDCVTGVCNMSNQCAAPTCSDSVENGNETDVDCGGTCPMDCADGKGCGTPGDCQSGVCSGQVCQTATCSDGVQNGTEGGPDCNGPCDAPCSLDNQFDVSQDIGLTSGDNGPAVAAMPDGSSFIVAWSKVNASMVGGFHIRARRFDATGTPLGDEFVVADDMTMVNTRQSPEIVAYNTGFLIVWMQNDGSQWDTMGQRYNAAGVAQGSEFIINTTTGGNQYSPDVDATAAGDIIVCWAPSDVDCQRLDASGSNVGTEIDVNTTTSGAQDAPAVAIKSDKTFLVAWQSCQGGDGNCNDTGGTGKWVIRGQWFDAADTPVKVGTELTISEDATEHAYNVDVGSDNSDRIAVVWTRGPWHQGNLAMGDTGPFAGPYDVMSQRYRSDRVANGANVMVNTTSADMSEAIYTRVEPHVAKKGLNGDWTVTWRSDDPALAVDDNDILGARLTNGGATIGGNFLVQSTETAANTNGNQQDQDVAILSETTGVFVWRGSTEVHARLFDMGF